MIVTSPISVKARSYPPDRQAKLTDVLICQLMGQAHTLRLVLNRLPIYDGTFEILHNCAVNGVALKHGTVSRFI